ncbi:hypothetical protein IC575_015042 [Cucumis melo]
MYFGLFLATGVFFIFIAFTMFLLSWFDASKVCHPLYAWMLLHHWILFALKGPKNHLHICSQKSPVGDGAGDGAGPDTVESGQSVPVAAGAGDTNICGGIVQLYWERILGRSLDLNGQVHQIALKVKSSGL